MTKNIRVDDEMHSFFRSLKKIPNQSFNDAIRSFVAWFYRYKCGYKLLRKYFDGIDDDDKVAVIKQLRALGLR